MWSQRARGQAEVNHASSSAQARPECILVGSKNTNRLEMWLSASDWVPTLHHRERFKKKKKRGTVNKATVLKLKVGVSKLPAVLLPGCVDPVGTGKWCRDW